MEKNIYPIRSFIRFQAQQQLLSQVNQASEPQSPQRFSVQGGAEALFHRAPGPICIDASTLDSALLKDITATLFESDRHPELYRPCQDILEATAIEEAIASEIVVTYLRIKQNEQHPAVQALNKLL
ncbi:MAG: hypothetical protein ACFB4J_14150 [Elainellaceae cyanobacterium]